MRVVLLAVVLGLLGLPACSGKRNIREWRASDHDQPEDEGQVEGGNPRQPQEEAPQAPAEPEQRAPADPDEQAVPSDPPQDDAEGAAVSVDVLWRQQCTRCHGRDGSGRTSMAQRIPVADLRESELTESEIVRVVTRGRREMPSFAEDLDAAAIRALAQKVISLRGEAQ